MVTRTSQTSPGTTGSSGGGVLARASAQPSAVVLHRPGVRKAWQLTGLAGPAAAPAPGFFFWSFCGACGTALGTEFCATRAPS